MLFFHFFVRLSHNHWKAKKKKKKKIDTNSNKTNGIFSDIEEPGTIQSNIHPARGRLLARICYAARIRYGSHALNDSYAPNTLLFLLLFFLYAKIYTTVQNKNPS